MARVRMIIVPTAIPALTAPVRPFHQFANIFGGDAAVASSNRYACRGSGSGTASSTCGVGDHVPSVGVNSCLQLGQVTGLPK